MSITKLYITCPICGKRLCKVAPGSELEQNCSKCSNGVLIRVDEDGRISTELMGSPKQAKQNA